MIIGYSSLGGTSTPISGTTGRLLYGTSQQANLSANQEAFRAFIGYGGSNNTALSNFAIGLYDVSGGNFTTAPRLCSFSLQINNAVEGGNSTQRWIEFPLTPFDLSAHSGKDLAIGFADPAANTGFNIPIITVTGATRKNHTGANNALPSTMANSTATSNQAWSMYIETRTIGAQTVLSINGGNPTTPGQIGVAASLNGFTATPSITTNTSGVTASSVSGSASAVTFNLSDRVEGGLYPALPAIIQYTFTNGSESAVGSQTLNVKSGEVKITLSSPIISDNTYIGFAFNADGFTVSGADFYYVPYGDLLIDSTGKITTTTAGVFTGWFRPTAGASAGRNYEYTFTISEAGQIVSSAKSLTTPGVASSRLTQAGISTAGL